MAARRGGLPVRSLIVSATAPVDGEAARPAARRHDRADAAPAHNDDGILSLMSPEEMDGSWKAIGPLHDAQLAMPYPPHGSDRDQTSCRKI